VLIIGLLALLLVLLYRRVRPYLKASRQFLHIVRHFQQSARGRVPDTKSEKLIRCEQCETWIPAGRRVL